MGVNDEIVCSLFSSTSLQDILSLIRLKYSSGFSLRSEYSFTNIGSFLNDDKKPSTFCLLNLTAFHTTLHTFLKMHFSFSTPKTSITFLVNLNGTRSTTLSFFPLSKIKSKSTCDTSPVLECSMMLSQCRSPSPIK